MELVEISAIVVSIHSSYNRIGLVRVWRTGNRYFSLVGLLALLMSASILAEDNKSKKISSVQTTEKKADEPVVPIIDLAKQTKALQKAGKLFKKNTYDMQPEVVDKVMRTLRCAIENNVDHNNILTVIDYSLPSNQKRFWVFDLPK